MLAAARKIEIEQLDDKVDQWHETRPMRDGCLIPLYEFLGMTQSQYEAWVRDGSLHGV